MKYEIRINGCKRTAMIEAMLHIMGAQEMIAPTELLFDEQIEFNSNVFHHDLKLPTGKRFGMFRNWIYVTFRYELESDIGRLQFRGEDRQIIDNLMNELSLLESKSDKIIDNSVLKTNKGEIEKLVQVQNEA